jgi:hypothetical protein
LSGYEYEGVRRVVYGDGATFVPVCEKCRRFVKANETVTFDIDGPPIGPTATCAKCGPTTMPFEGYVS